MQWLKRFASGWSIPGWVTLLLWLSIFLLDWSDRLDSIKLKAGRVLPILHPLIEFVTTPKGQILTLVIGLALLFIATWRKLDRTPIATEGLSKISRRLDEEIEKGRVGLGHLDVPPPLDQTAIESIDEVMEKCRILEGIFASLSDPLPDNQPRALVEEVRTILRRYAPGYVDKFNSAVRNPKRFANFPAVMNRTVEELGKWTSDKTRRDGWDIIDSILRYLALVRSNLYSKLP